MDTRSWQPVLVPSWLAKVKHLPGHWKACTLKEYFCQLKKKAHTAMGIPWTLHTHHHGLVQSLVKELRSHKPCGMTKKKKE